MPGLNRGHKVLLKFLLTLVILTTFGILIYAQQTPLNQKISFSNQALTLENYLKEIEQSTDFNFIYSPMLLPVDMKLSLPDQSTTVIEFLNFLKYNHNILYRIDKNNISLKLTDKPTKIRITGFVEDAMSGERLIAANVYNVNYEGTITNSYGFYSLTTPLESIPISYNYVGYKPFSINTTFTKDTFIVVKLEPAIDIMEVKIVGREKMLIDEKDNKTTYLPARFIDNIPAVFGEGDILKAIQLVPGAQSGLENTNGISVRGGNPGENLILLDGVKLYHYSHLLGILSIFDNNLVKTSKIIKGGIPANYGGRSSSVIDIIFDEGDKQNYYSDVTVGFPTSRASIQGPIQKGKSSFVLSARSSYRNLFKMVPEDFNQDDAEKKYFFYDITAKTNFSLSKKDKLFLSFYTGSDIFHSTDFNENLLEKIINENITKARWGNKASILKWNHVFNESFFSNVSVSYSNSEFRQQNDYFHQKTTESDYVIENYHENINSTIEDITAQANVEFTPNKNQKIQAGYSYSYYSFMPNVNGFVYSDLQNFYTTNATSVDQNMEAFENALFLNNIFTFGNLSLNPGIRASVYSVPQKNYIDISPRFSVDYSITKRTKLFGTYSLMQQPVHLLTYTHLILPTDLWVSATKNVKPSRSDQYSLGFSYAISDNIKFTSEGYIKLQKNLIEYNRGPEFLNMNIGWEDKIETGKAENYGVEFLLQKTNNKLSGWVSYTFSRALRKYQSFTSWIPYEYDKPHVINLVGNYKLTPNLEVGGTWIFTSGRPFTFSSTAYRTVIEDYRSILFDTENYNYQINSVEKKNNARMPDYHRLDLSAKYQRSFKNGFFVIKAGVFNVYNRRNPIFMYAKDGSMYTTSIFPILPFFQYKFNFKAGI